MKTFLFGLKCLPQNYAVHLEGLNKGKRNRTTYHHITNKYTIYNYIKILTTTPYGLATNPVPVRYFRDSNINDQLIIKMQQLQINLLSIALID